MKKYGDYCLKEIKNINFIIAIILGISISVFSIYILHYLDKFIYVIIFIVIFILFYFLFLKLFIYNELFIGYLIIFLPIMPMFQRLLTYKEKITIDIFVLSLELFFVVSLIILFLSKKVIYVKIQYKNILKDFNYLISLWIICNLVSVFFSINIYRSFLLFIIGVLGPAFVFYIITNKTKINYNTFKFLLLSLISSGVVALLLGFFTRFRYKYIFDRTVGLMELRMYGSNSIIGIISFILPFIFLETIEGNNKFKNKLILSIFRILSILWIIVALSRWGYFTFFVALILTFILDRGNKKKYYYLVIVILIFVLQFLSSA